MASDSPVELIPLEERQRREQALFVGEHSLAFARVVLPSQPGTDQSHERHPRGGEDHEGDEHFEQRDAAPTAPNQRGLR